MHTKQTVNLNDIIELKLNSHGVYIYFNHLVDQNEMVCKSLMPPWVRSSTAFNHMILYFSFMDYNEQQFYIKTFSNTGIRKYLN